MQKIFDIKEAGKVAKKEKKNDKKIVLVGGCFDILHIGHLAFLTKAKEYGDVLFVLLESDEAIKKSKGQHRPINQQKDRAALLSALTVVDYVIIVPKRLKNTDYDQLVKGIHPNVIATTAGDPYRLHKERQASIIGAQVVDVIKPINDASTTRIAKLLEKEL